MGYRSARYSRKIFALCVVLVGAIASPSFAESILTESRDEGVVTVDVEVTEVEPDSIIENSDNAVIDDTGTVKPQSILVSSEVTNGIDPSTAVTVRHLNTPIDRLQLMIKPLARVELEVEAAAWYLLLKDKIQHISDTEIAIKIENQATEDEKKAQQLMREAIVKIAAAEEDLDDNAPDSNAYRQALLALEAGKDDLYLAEEAVHKAVKTMREFQEDPLLQMELAKAKMTEKLAIARQVLDRSISARNGFPVNSDEYRELTREIDFFDKSFLKLRELEDDLNDTVPLSEEFEEVQESIQKVQDLIISHALDIVDSDLIDFPEANSGLRNNVSVLNYLDKIEQELFETEEILRKEAENHQKGSGDRILKQLNQVVAELDEAIVVQRQLKNQLLNNVVDLQEEEIRIVDRFRIVLSELDKKGGETKEYRAYVNAVQSFEFDFKDTQAFQVRLLSWIKSDEGGVRLGVGLLKCITIMGASLVIARVVTRVIGRFMGSIDGISSLLQEFVMVVVRRGIILTGVLISLTSLGVSLGPVIALFGGVSFVLAFALQSNLGNFASGLMLLINKPFDVGDEVRIGGYTAFVSAISLVNTKLKDSNGNIITLPNNEVWGGDIVNYSHAEKRRLVFKFFVKFDQNIEELKKMWFEIAAEQPEIYDDPGPSLSCPWNASYEYSIRVDLKAWCSTPRYRPVYITTLQVLQEKMAELNIELAAPTQFVKYENESLEKFLIEGDRPQNLAN